MKYSRLNQAAIVDALRGQTLRTPNLHNLFRSWPNPQGQLNTHHEHVTPIVNQAVDRMAIAYPLIARRKQDDIASLVCSLYPQARQRQIEALTLYTTWLVCWDDAVDANEGDLAVDFTRAERWRGQTMRMVREALVIDEMNVSEADDDPINSVFREFGARFCQTASRDYRRLLHDEIQFFINSCAAEQKLRLASHIPDYESYMKMRIGTVGGRMLCSLVPYAIDERLPEALSSAPEIVQTWTQVSIIQSLMNDMLSLKKELRTDCVINAVAAIMESGMTLDVVVAKLEERMKMAVKNFDKAANELLQKTEFQEQTHPIVKRYVDGCRSIVTGTLRFTLTSPRYNIHKLIEEDGSLKITL
ncbi:isoprenoid synthase domain-containing protein [Fusarium redolens]|uniref:Terpene synthase n=1 Tax=Fusarium redolens TaxID=48865 RepID=A0A9P9KX10_FUSRE|nr:isoprenoid synthase domain-containing protein [Fusarium redolens]KAH7269885.1 isoprenoid synthase domain-containing protein [Fusarium redolens]